MPGRLRADFSFVTADGDLILWEHLGMLSRPDYKGWEWKRNWAPEERIRRGQDAVHVDRGRRQGSRLIRLREISNAIKKLME